MEQNMSKQGPEISPHYIADDEIDLVQLFQVLLKRKYLILGVMFFCLLGGGGYALLQDSVYEYTTTLQIGTTLTESGDTVTKVGLEGSNSVQLKLEKVYIPAAVNKLSSKEGRLIYASAEEQKGSNIILVTSKGGAEDEQLFKYLHTLIVSPLINNHRETIAASKNRFILLAERAQLILQDMENPSLLKLGEITLQRKIESTQKGLAGFDDQKLLLLANQAGLGKTKGLTTKQISHIEKNLQFSHEKRQRAVSDVDGAAEAMAFMLLNNDIQQNENHLALLRERLHVSLENQKQQLEGQVAENQRARKLQVSKIEEAKTQLTQLRAQRLSEQHLQRNTIATAKNRIDLYQDTRALNIAARSLQPVGFGKSLILALAGILGLMGGIMLAFGAEFMVKVRQQQRTGCLDE